MTPTEQPKKISKSWKTTLAGLLLGIALTTGQIVDQRMKDPNSPPITFGNALPGIAIAVLGALSKDYDVTGGTRQ